MPQDTFYIEQLVLKHDPNHFWFYKWTAFNENELDLLRTSSEKTNTYSRTVAYFRIKLKNQ